MVSSLCDFAKRHKFATGSVVALAVIGLLVLTAFLVIENVEEEPLEHYLLKIPDLGQIDGVQVNAIDGGRSYEFYGIPFAQPPTGQLRFAAPVFEPSPSWEGVRDGTKRANRCMQRHAHDDDLFHYDEDCLYLAVATNDFSAKNPVLVYFHGGSFWTGTGDNWRTDLAVLASKGLTVVTVNYRLGPLGFAGFEGEFLGQNSIGNFGLMDQYAALAWVQKHIHNFGGDPTKVTTFGESAGAESAMAHVLWDKSRRDNHVVSSIPISWPVLPYKEAEESIAMNKRLASKLDCLTNDLNPVKRVPDINCMRELEAAAIADTIIVPVSGLQHLSANAQLWPPTIDDNIVTGQNVDLFKNLVEQGEMPPLMIGVESEEGVSLIKDIFSGPGGDQMYRLSVEVIFHAIADEIYRLYPYDQDDGVDARVIIAQMITDYAFYCPARFLTDLADNGSYLFLWEKPWNTGKPSDNNDPMNCKNVACHSEIQRWIFGDHQMLDRYWKSDEPQYLDKRFTNRYPSGPILDPRDIEIDAEIQDLVREFLDSLKISSWPENSARDNYLMPDLSRNGTWHQVTGYRASFCDYWDELDLYSHF